MHAKYFQWIKCSLHGDQMLIIIHAEYSSPSILQPSILRPPSIIKPLDFGPKWQFSVLLRPHFLGPMGGLKIEGPLL